MPSRMPALDAVVIGTMLGGIAAFFILGLLVGWPLGGLIGSSLVGAALVVGAWHDRADLLERLPTREGRAQTAWVLLIYLTMLVPSLIAVFGSHLLAGVILFLGFILVIISASLYEWDNQRRARAAELPMRPRVDRGTTRPPIRRPPPHSDDCTECGPAAEMRRIRDGEPLTEAEMLPETCPCTEALAHSFPGVGLIGPGLGAPMGEGDRRIPCLWCHAEAMRQPVEGVEFANATESDDPQDEDEEAAGDTGP